MIAIELPDEVMDRGSIIQDQLKIWKQKFNKLDNQGMTEVTWVTGPSEWGTTTDHHAHSSSLD